MEGNADYQVQKNDYPNLKGVMLCARPDEKQNIERERQVFLKTTLNLRLNFEHYFDHFLSKF